jgi:hypothetical protein
MEEAQLSRMRPEVTGGNALEADPNFFSIIKGIFVEAAPGQICSEM